MPEKQPLPNDSHDIVDGSRLVKIGVRTDDNVTAAAGATRLIKILGINISPGLAKILGLDKMKVKED